MVYDPYTGTFGDADGGDSLFAIPSDDDPFGIPTDDVEDPRFDESTEWSKPASHIPSGTVGSISYDRGDNEIVGRPTQVDGDNGARSPRATAVERAASEERGARDRSDTGNRNIRRAAGRDEEGTGTGSTGDGPLATSLSDAATRLRTTIQPTGDERKFNPATSTIGVDRGVGEFIKTIAAGKSPTHLTTEAAVPDFTHRLIHDVPTFTGADFECEIYACKMNAAGDWLVTVKVPYGYRHVVTDLSGAAGMNLKTHMELDGFVADR